MMVIGILLILVSVMGYAGGKSDSGQINLRVLFYLEATVPNAIADANLWFNTIEHYEKYYFA